MTRPLLRGTPLWAVGALLAVTLIAGACYEYGTAAVQWLAMHPVVTALIAIAVSAVLGIAWLAWWAFRAPLNLDFLLQSRDASEPEFCAQADLPPELDPQTDAERRTGSRTVNLSLLLGAVTLGGQLI